VTPLFIDAQSIDAQPTKHRSFALLKSTVKMVSMKKNHRHILLSTTKMFN